MAAGIGAPHSAGLGSSLAAGAWSDLCRPSPSLAERAPRGSYGASAPEQRIAVGVVAAFLLTRLGVRSRTASWSAARRTQVAGRCESSFQTKLGAMLRANGPSPGHFAFNASALCLWLPL